MINLPSSGIANDIPVAITYLHHTHMEVPHYEADNWTFVKGALATVDREFGFVGRHLFHCIIEHHVVHHLFPYVYHLHLICWLSATNMTLLQPHSFLLCWRGN